LSRHRVIVTGGCGFVGSPLVRMLVEEVQSEVLVIDDYSVGSAQNLGAARDEIELVDCDVRDRDRVVNIFKGFRPDTVIHTAAVHFIPACNRDPKRCVDVNVGGTQAVLDGAAATSPEAVVLVSSAAVYAPSPVAHPDDGLVGPTDIYGLSKRWTEQLGSLFHERTEVPVRAARLFNVFGPGETNPHLIPAIIAQAESGEDLRLGNLSTKRDYVFVEDVAKGLIALGADTSDQGYLTCNLGAEQAVDGDEIVATVARLMGRELRVVSDPSRLRASDRPVLLSDCSRARETLRWTARWGLEDGLRAAIEQPTATGIVVD
jgi:UDP-glucose 4-epimerase